MAKIHMADAACSAHTAILLSSDDVQGRLRQLRHRQRTQLPHPLRGGTLVGNATSSPVLEVREHFTDPRCVPRQRLVTESLQPGLRVRKQVTSRLNESSE